MGPGSVKAPAAKPLTHGDRKSFPAQVSEAVGLPKKNSATCAGAADHWRSPWDATGLPAAVSSGDGEVGPVYMPTGVRQERYGRRVAVMMEV